MNEKEAWRVLKLCDKLSDEQLIELGAYLIACAVKSRKPTQGTK
jgi:hypothetical protein